MVADEELSQTLQKSSYFSLMIDESTDVCTTQTVVAYIWFVCRGDIITLFWSSLTTWWDS